MTYRQPTFFGMAYAARLFHEIETAKYLPKLREKVGLHPDFLDQRHALAVLLWLNEWGCRIRKSQFGAIAIGLSEWFDRQRHQLPRGEIQALQHHELDAVAAAYGELLAITEFGPTTAAKALFAVCPAAAIPWDKAIQNEFGLVGRDAGQYRGMLERSREEAKALIADAARCGVVDHQTIMDSLGSQARTIPELLDQYHWITITRRHLIPNRDDLKRWMAWERREVTA